MEPLGNVRSLSMFCSERAAESQDGSREAWQRMLSAGDIGLNQGYLKGVYRGHIGLYGGHIGFRV